MIVKYCNSYTMVFPHVREINTRALLSGLFPKQVDKHSTTFFYDTLLLIIVDLRDILC